MVYQKYHINKNQDINRCPKVPESIMTASRCELTDIQMKIWENLPADLHGHVFMVAPTGTVDSDGLPFANGDSLLCGDGMIYRLDFDCQDEVKLTTRIAKPPDYYADKATRHGSKYDKYRFRNHGITRFSLSLGVRNQLNTAFLPMKFSQDENERLLVTYDAGRPYEIDTQTLEVVTPIGANKEWQPELNGYNAPFPAFLSTAHPAFDPHTQQMFTVNYGRLLANLIDTIPFIYDHEQLPQEIPAYLFRLHTSSKEAFAIADRYKFPPGHMTLSPQFIPCRNGEKPTDGYIICTVWYEDKNEFWLFDANNLSKGLKCKLSHPSLDFGLTLHTAWLPTIGERQATYYINVCEDYNKLVHEASQKHPDIKDLFEQEIYPHFD